MNTIMRTIKKIKTWFSAENIDWGNQVLLSCPNLLISLTKEATIKVQITKKKFKSIQEIKNYLSDILNRYRRYLISNGYEIENDSNINLFQGDIYYKSYDFTVRKYRKNQEDFDTYLIDFTIPENYQLIDSYEELKAIIDNIMSQLR